MPRISISWTNATPGRGRMKIARLISKPLILHAKREHGDLVLSGNSRMLHALFFYAPTSGFSLSTSRTRRRVNTSNAPKNLLEKAGNNERAPDWSPVRYQEYSTEKLYQKLFTCSDRHSSSENFIRYKLSLIRLNRVKYVELCLIKFPSKTPHDKLLTWKFWNRNRCGYSCFWILVRSSPTLRRTLQSCNHKTRVNHVTESPKHVYLHGAWPVLRIRI